jgi:hypothetical protein
MKNRGRSSRRQFDRVDYPGEVEFLYFVLAEGGVVGDDLHERWNRMLERAELNV